VSPVSIEARPVCATGHLTSEECAERNRLYQEVRKLRRDKDFVRLD
jgi:hypothetical protein